MGYTEEQSGAKTQETNATSKKANRAESTSKSSRSRSSCSISQKTNRDQIADRNQSETVNKVEQSNQDGERTEGQNKPDHPPTSKSRKFTKNTYDYESELYNTLKDWRDRVAHDQGVPKGRVFDDLTLKRIADKKPLNESSLRYTKGVGPRRADRYGKGILSLLPNREDKERKIGWEDVRETLNSESINELYHFTDRANLPSIRLNGGLYSWSHCENNNIDVTRPGGNQVSRNLDRENGLEDYVRLSFVKKPPMYYVATRDGRIQNPAILEVSPKVALWASTLFSDGNAIANRARIGGRPQDLSRIRFDILRQSDWTSESEKHYWQAEVLVKTHVPLRYMSNYL